MKKVLEIKEPLKIIYTSLKLKLQFRLEISHLNKQFSIRNKNFSVKGLILSQIVIVPRNGG